MRMLKHLPVDEWPDADQDVFRRYRRTRCSPLEWVAHDDSVHLPPLARSPRTKSKILSQRFPTRLRAAFDGIAVTYCRAWART